VTKIDIKLNVGCKCNNIQFHVNHRHRDIVIHSLKMSIKMKARIAVESITQIKKIYPTLFIEFCTQHDLHPPKPTTKNGKALSAMLHNLGRYWDRAACDDFVKKFNITTRDSIQLFNKHEQWGIRTSRERGKNYILFPFQLSMKHKMRKEFTFDGTTEEFNAEVDKIKSTIQADYIDVPASDWQLGHKNPETTDNSTHNLVLQPPIQAKYRDKYIFLDTLTKIPTPTEMIRLHESDKLPITKQQLLQLRDWLNKIDLS